MADNEVVEWSWGMPLEGERVLAPGERAAIRRWSVAMLASLAGAWALLITLLCVLGAVAQRPDASSAVHRDALSAAATLLVFGGLPLTLVLSRRWVARTIALGRDLHRGAVRRYCGPVDEAFSADQTIVMRLAKAGMLPAGNGALWSIEVLPISRRVLRIDGRTADRWFEAPATRLAQTPAFSAVAAQWLQPIGRSAGGQVLGGRRDLSQAERSEITRHARRMTLRPLPWAVGAALWLTAGLLGLASQAAPVTDYGQLAFVGLLAGACGVALGKAVVLARRLLHDRDEGYVTILMLQPGPTPLEEMPVAAAKDDNGPVEMLPSAGMIWTEQGRPSTWRKLA